MANPRFCVKLQDYQPMTKDYGRHIAENIAKGEVFSKRFVTLAVWPNVSGWISPTWAKILENYFHFRNKSPIWPHCILGTYTNELHLKMNCWTSKFGLVCQLLMVGLLSQPVQILSYNLFFSGINFFENTLSHYIRLKNVSFWLHVHKGREKTSWWFWSSWIRSQRTWFRWRTPFWSWNWTMTLINMWAT